MANSGYSQWKFFGLNLWQQIIIAMIVGIATGLIYKEAAVNLQIIGVIFIKLIKMVVAPLIFFALIYGITSLTQEHHFKKIVIKGVLAYFLTAMFAVSIGLILAIIFKPGIGFTPPPEIFKPNITQPILDIGKQPTITDFLIGLIPSNIIHAMASDLYLQIVAFAIFAGVVMNNIRNESKNIRQLNIELCNVTFKMIEWIIRITPLAVFGFLASSVGATGLSLLSSLAKLVILVIGACTLQYILYGILIRVFAQISPIPFYKKTLQAQIIAFSTTSSKAALSTAMRNLQEKVGVSIGTSNFMMPLGSCVNTDGTALYLAIISVFFAQIYNVPLDFTDYMMLLLTCTLGSISAAGIPSGSLIVMSMVLNSVGIPIEGIAMLLAIDRILDMFRTTVNVAGDCAITIIVDKTEESLDTDLYHR